MKLFNYLIIMLTMMLFLEFTGVHTGISDTLGKINININQENSNVESADFTNSEIFDKIFNLKTGILALAVVGSIIVGLYAKGFDVAVIIAPIASYIGITFVDTFILIINYALKSQQDWLIWIVCTIFIPLGFGFVIAVIDWFGGDR